MTLKDVIFITKPDETGLGRVVVNGRFYGLPVWVIEEIIRLAGRQKSKDDK